MNISCDVFFTKIQIFGNQNLHTTMIYPFRNFSKGLPGLSNPERYGTITDLKLRAAPVLTTVHLNRHSATLHVKWTLGWWPSRW